MIRPCSCRPSHERLDLRINQRLAATDRDHRRVAFFRRRQAILQGQKIFQRSRIFPNPAAPGAGEITGMQRFKLQDCGKFFRPANLVADDVGGNLRREGERKSHKCGILTSMLSLSMEGTWRPIGRRFGQRYRTKSIPKWHLFLKKNATSRCSAPRQNRTATPIRPCACWPASTTGRSR